MPAVSKKQQKLFAIVKAYKDGKNDKVDQKVKDIANNISDDDATDMASTSTKGLPDKVSKEEIVRALIHNEIMSEGKADKYDKIVDKFAKTLRLKNGYKIYDNKLVMKTNLSQSTLDQWAHAVKKKVPNFRKTITGFTWTEPSGRMDVSPGYWGESVDEAKDRDYAKEYQARKGDYYEKYQSSTKAKKYRAELNQYNRDKGTYGNGDKKDASHKGGKIVGFESENKNRSRKEKSRLKKETNEGAKFGKFGKDAYSWKASNLIHNKAYTGVSLKDLASFLDSEGLKNVKKSIDGVVNKLLKTGDYKLVNDTMYYKTYTPKNESVNEASIAWDWNFKGEKIVDTVKFRDFNIKLASMPYNNVKIYYAVADTGEKLNQAPKMFKRPMDAIRAVKKMLFGRKSEAVFLEGEDLGFGHLGNGITVFDRSREEHGDYKKVAHISAHYNKHEIKYYDKKLSSSAKKQIKKAADHYWKTAKNEIDLPPRAHMRGHYMS